MSIESRKRRTWQRCMVTPLPYSRQTIWLVDIFRNIWVIPSSPCHELVSMWCMFLNLLLTISSVIIYSNVQQALQYDPIHSKKWGYISSIQSYNYVLYVTLYRLTRVISFKVTVFKQTLLTLSFIQKVSFRNVISDLHCLAVRDQNDKFRSKYPTLHRFIFIRT